MGLLSSHGPPGSRHEYYLEGALLGNHDSHPMGHAWESIGGME